MGQAVESEKYWTMNGITDRFQEKVLDADWLAGTYEAESVDLSAIQKIPISMFTATGDTTCPHATAMKYIPQIGSATNYIDVEGVDHDYFHSAATSEWFMENLIAQLQVPTT